MKELSKEQKLDALDYLEKEIKKYKYTDVYICRCFEKFMRKPMSFGTFRVLFPELLAAIMKKGQELIDEMFGGGKIFTFGMAFSCINRNERRHRLEVINNVRKQISK